MKPVPDIGRAALRPWRPTDLQGVLQVQRACYSAAYLEPDAVYARRLAMPDPWSLVLDLDGQVMAYAAAYATQRGHVTALHGDFEVLEGADTLTLHDLAVHPQLAGQGVARRMVAALWQRAQARGLTFAALVAVQGSRPFWEGLGYAAGTPAGPLQCERLRAYGPEAVYMQRRLGPASGPPPPQPG